MYFASVLKEAGCTIIYGMQNFKVHSKITPFFCPNRGRSATSPTSGTGNYNEKTSKQYTDLNIITADEEIGEDGAAFFRNVAICNTEYDYKRLLIAPEGLKKGLIERIDGRSPLRGRGNLPSSPPR